MVQIRKYNINNSLISTSKTSPMKTNLRGILIWDLIVHEGISKAKKVKWEWVNQRWGTAENCFHLRAPGTDEARGIIGVHGWGHLVTTVILLKTRSLAETFPRAERRRGEISCFLLQTSTRVSFGQTQLGDLWQRNKNSTSYKSEALQICRRVREGWEVDLRIKKQLTQDITKA